jgi:hypothetical protein
MSDVPQTRLYLCYGLTTLAVVVIVYLSPFWPFQFWTNQHWLAQVGLHPRGDMITRWARQAGIAPFAILIWAAVSLVMLELAQKVRR